ncbi:MAG: hypothetical protein LAT54_00315 [Cryomorphaceae bacterium]|nr:hypothetical protein [Cryomorphaceae bacterium]
MRISAYILLLSLTLPFLSKTADIAKYLLSYDAYLAACENFDRPEMQCNGTCQWAKEHTEKKDAPMPPSIPESLKVEIIVFNERAFSLSLNLFNDIHCTLVPFEKSFVKENISEVPTPPPNVLI